jgi:indole-3-glycerol phosphate synthase
MTILDEIMAAKATEVAKMKAVTPSGLLQAQIETLPIPHSARKAFLTSPRKGLASHILSEVKEASPSKGILRPGLDGVALAKEYEQAGATAISVLTDQKYFKGSYERLEAIRPHVSVPILAKEFISDPWQIERARVAGADFILLIVAALDPTLLQELVGFAHKLQMEVLIEVHDEDELTVALEAGGDLIGVNNRDLKTFSTSIENSLRLAPLMPKGTVTLSESGIRTREDIVTLECAGFDGFLIGEGLVISSNPGDKLGELGGRTP